MVGRQKDGRRTAENCSGINIQRLSGQTSIPFRSAAPSSHDLPVATVMLCARSKRLPTTLAPDDRSCITPSYASWKWQFLRGAIAPLLQAVREGWTVVDDGCKRGGNAVSRKAVTGS